MNLIPYSWNGNTFAANDFYAFIPDSEALLQAASPVGSERGGNTPMSIDRRYTNPVTTAMQIELLGTVAEEADQFLMLQKWFDTIGPLAGDEDNFGVLVARDADDTDREWQIVASPITLTKEHNSAVVVLLAREAYWKVVTAESVLFECTSSGTFEVVEPIGIKAKPRLTFTPQSAKSVGLSYRTWREVAWPSATIEPGIYPLDVGNGINTAALVSGGKVQSNGDDFRVFSDGLEVPRWFGNWNTTSTRVWVSLRWRPKLTFTLGTAMPTGSVFSIELSPDTSQESWNSLPRKGLVRIGTEVFVYNYKDPTQKILWYRDPGTRAYVDLERGARQSTEGTHAAGVTVTWIQHDIYFTYGSQDVMPAPTLDERKKPMFDLDASNNSTWVFNDFKIIGAGRVMPWVPGGDKGALKLSGVYYATQGDIDTDTVSDPGMKILTGKVNNTWKGETATVTWRINSPVGFSNVSASGKSYRNYTSTYPAATIQKAKSLTNLKYVTVSTVSAPASVSTWTAWSLGSTSLGTRYCSVMLQLKGSIPAPPASASTAYEYDFEAGTVTLSVYGSGIPTITSTAEQTTAAAFYKMDAVVRNGANGQDLRIQARIRAGLSLVVDCDARQAFLTDGTQVQGAVSRVSSRTEWMVLEEGENEIYYTEQYVTGMDVLIEFHSRTPLKP